MTSCVWRMIVFVGLTSCAYAPKNEAAYTRNPAQAAVATPPVDLTKLWTYEVTDFEQRLLSETLKTANLGQFVAEVKIVDPLQDPYGTYEAVLKPVGWALEKMNLYKSNNYRFVPRQVKYYTRQGHVQVSSCTLYLFQANPPTNRVAILSDVCRAAKGIKIEGETRISGMNLAVATISEGLGITNVQLQPPERLRDLDSLLKSE